MKAKWSEERYGWSYLSLPGKVDIEAGYERGSYCFRYRSTLQVTRGFSSLQEAQKAGEQYLRKLLKEIGEALGEE